MAIISFNWQYSSINWNNGLVTNRQEAITWTNADAISWRIYAYVALGGGGGGGELADIVIFNPFSMTISLSTTGVWYL